MVGLKPGQSIRHFLRLKRAEPTPAIVEQWIGISTDEIFRVAPSRHAYIHNRHVLIEARMSRRDCLRWLEERQYPRPPKSACTFCPFHDDSMWLDMRRDDPESFADACAVDAALRIAGRHKGMKGELFVHRTCVPLAEVEFKDGKGAGLLGECGGNCWT